MSRADHVPGPPSEEVLQRFGYRQEFRRELKRIIYLATVILYVCTRHKLPRSHGFNLGAFEWPVVMLALV